jgi:hypothetical protein
MMAEKLDHLIERKLQLRNTRRDVFINIASPKQCISL